MPPQCDDKTVWATAAPCRPASWRILETKERHGVSSVDRVSVLLIDAENVIGPSKPRLPVVRARAQTLLAAAGPVHHAVACYAHEWPADTTVTSALIELGIVPWPVPADRDAAEIALAGHARYLSSRGSQWRFLVASGDHRLAEVADYGELHVLIWEGHPLARRLGSAAVAVHRLTKPGRDGPSRPPLDLADTEPTIARSSAVPSRFRAVAGQAATAFITGIGIALGRRLVDTAASRFVQRAQSAADRGEHRRH